MQLIPDTMDLSAYMGQDGFAAKVRRADSFDLDAEFDRRLGQYQPSMFSTKLGAKIEFRPGEVTAWAGYNGHRKSMFTGQVAADLVCQRQRVLVASLEMSPGRTLARMARQVWGEIPSQHQRQQFAKWTADKLWLFDHVGEITPAHCLALCRYFADELRGHQVFIDSMMKVCQSEERLDEQKKLVTDLCRVAMDTGLHIHLVAHARKPNSGGEEKPPTKYDLRGSAAISDQCANVITVWMNKEKKASQSPAHADPDALVTVEKQRNAEWEGRLQLWFHAPSMRFTDAREDYVEPYAGLAT